ncbi:MAG: STAS domain-containing protein [Spirochaetes bacterium]|nr:STAS domain-containing protein [Spirochaetota bacterium]
MKKFFEVTSFENYNIVEIMETELTIHNTTQFLVKLKSEVIDRYKLHLILDLKNIQYADSSFLAKLIKIHKQLHAKQKKLVIISVQKNLYEIMCLAQLDRMLIIKPDISAAANFVENRL